MKVLEGHTDTITAMAIRDDELYSSSCDFTVRKWKLSDCSCTTIFHTTGWVWDFCLSKDHLFAACQDALVKKFDKKTGEFIRNFDGHQAAVSRILFIEGEKTSYIVTSSWDGTLRVFDQEVVQSIVMITIASPVTKKNNKKQ